MQYSDSLILLPCQLENPGFVSMEVNLDVCLKKYVASQLQTVVQFIGVCLKFQGVRFGLGPFRIQTSFLMCLVNYNYFVSLFYMYFLFDVIYLGTCLFEKADRDLLQRSDLDRDRGQDVDRISCFAPLLVCKPAIEGLVPL